MAPSTQVCTPAPSELPRGLKINGKLPSPFHRRHRSIAAVRLLCGVLRVGGAPRPSKESVLGATSMIIWILTWLLVRAEVDVQY